MLQNVTVERSTTTERVASALRAEMLAGRLLPGTQVSEISVSQTLGISRNTLREAMQTLEFEGLLSWRGNRRVVTVPSADDVRDIYRVRAMLETSGIEASKAAPPELHHNLQAAFDALERAVDGDLPDLVVERHIDFHEAIVAFIGSPILCHTFRTTMQKLRLALLLADRDRADLPEQTESHRRLLHQIQQGDLKACAKQVRLNFAKAEQEVLESLAQAHTPRTTG